MGGKRSAYHATIMLIGSGLGLDARRPQQEGGEVRLRILLPRRGRRWPAATRLIKHRDRSGFAPLGLLWGLFAAVVTIRTTMLPVMPLRAGFADIGFRLFGARRVSHPGNR